MNLYNLLLFLFCTSFISRDKRLCTVHWFSMIFRLAFIFYNQAEVPVNWCPALGTVLANEEVVDGVSERGGYPVIRKVSCTNCRIGSSVNTALSFQL
jgi:hypothetical protein